MIRRDFEIYRYRYMDEVELHHHDFYEIYMLLRGSVSYTVENRIFHMRAGGSDADQPAGAAPSAG